MIKRLRVEPISDYLERYRKAESFPVSIANGFVFVLGLPPFDPETGEIKQVPFEQEAERRVSMCSSAMSIARPIRCTSSNSTGCMIHYDRRRSTSRPMPAGGGVLGHLRVAVKR